MARTGLLTVLLLLLMIPTAHAQVHDHFDRKDIISATCHSAHVSARLVQSLGFKGDEFYLRVRGENDEIIKTAGPLPRLTSGQTLDLDIDFPEQPEGTSIYVVIYYKGTFSPYVEFRYVCSESEDTDGDEILNSKDNCPYAYNPEQTDTWGGTEGDACDLNYYDRFQVRYGYRVYGFALHDGTMLIRGNCSLGYICQEIARFNPSELVPDESPRFELPSSYGWYIVVYYLGLSRKGEQVYQVNVYDSTDTLIDDRLEIYREESGEWYWKQAIKKG